MALIEPTERPERYIPPGTLVRYDGLREGGPEYGIVIHCWQDEEHHFYDCFVAFFGKSPPQGQPDGAPYVLRYFATSLTVIDESHED